MFLTPRSLRHTAVAVAIAIGFAAFSTTTAAQTRGSGAPTQAPAVEGKPEPVLPPMLHSRQNAAEVRTDFYEVLDQHPPAVGRVMRLDPTLMTNPSYLASYPKIAVFLAQHPDIARNPGYYLERYDPNYAYNQPLDPKREALRMWRESLEFLGAFLVFTVIALMLFSIIKYLVEYRRWHRISKVNAEVHNKILDRFGSNEELLAYIDSPAGRRFLEATPIAPTGAAPRAVSAPFGRIMLSVQIGILLVAGALGLWIVSNRAIEEIRQLLVGIAVLAFFLGVGSIVSAAASYTLSRRLGLLSDGNAARPPQAV